MGLEDERIKGRTEALDFVATLIEQWRKYAQNSAYDIVTDAVEDCADQLEQKIEDFATT